MHHFGTWMERMVAMLQGEDVDGMLATMAALGAGRGAVVPLVEADLSLEEAVGYACLLFELGDDQRARELVHACMLVSMSIELTPAAPPVPLVTTAAAQA